jgi:hypothetical protein
MSIFNLGSARRAAVVATVTAVALSLAGPGYGDTTSVPATPITMSVQTVNGSGCPSGTARVSALPGNTGFRVRYESFLAQDGGSADPTDIRKNCQIALLLNIPQGFTLAVARADYRGVAHLESGATGLERSNYYFQGDSGNNYADHTFKGPLDGSWSATDVAPVLEWSPCGQQVILNINSELRVDANGSGRTNFMSMRASDGNVDTLVQFSWANC